MHMAGKELRKVSWLSWPNHKRVNQDFSAFFWLLWHKIVNFPQYFTTWQTDAGFPPLFSLSLVTNVVSSQNTTFTSFCHMTWGGSYSWHHPWHNLVSQLLTLTRSCQEVADRKSDQQPVRVITYHFHSVNAFSFLHIIINCWTEKNLHLLKLFYSNSLCILILFSYNSNEDEELNYSDL